MKRILAYIKHLFQRGTDKRFATPLSPDHVIDTLAPLNTSASATYWQLRHRLVCRLCRPHPEQRSDSVTLWHTPEYFERTGNPKKERAS